MPALIVLNGPPAVGKSTIARRYADEHPLCLRIDVDEVREQLGAWRQSPHEAGLRARALAAAMAANHLRAGHDVVIAQLYGGVDHLVELEAVASDASASYHEIVLMTDVGSTLDRFSRRGGSRLDDALAAPDGLGSIRVLHERVEAIAAARPQAVVVTSIDDDVQATYEAVLRVTGAEHRAAPTSTGETDPLLADVELLVFYAELDDPRSAGVKLIHHATGIEAESMTEPTRVANRDRALRLLRERLAAEPGADGGRGPAASPPGD